MSDLTSNFLQLKKEIILKEFSYMNDMQQKAIFKTNGPVLILAGAGSGKTTVMVNRISYMVNYGNTMESNYIPQNLSENDINTLKEYLDGSFEDKDYIHNLLADNKILPWNILAITFTNKAANELKERLSNMLGEQALDINSGTFHSTCVRILRREISALGYDSNFTIYDTDDSVRVIKDCLKDLNLADSSFQPKSILSEIGKCKDKDINPEEYLASAGMDFRKQSIAKIYERYQKKLKQANAVDFDDIIILTVRLFTENPDILEKYQNRFKYIMVDEYQDTNNAQYRLISLLSKKNNNLCVVGDDDQSIYRFRGATIENILMFEEQFDNAFVIRLEQNYRSTQNILDAANEVIKNNFERKGKNLWTSNGAGDKITVLRATDENDESNYVTEQILENVKNGKRFSDHAVLYRMNAISSNIERRFLKSGITYKVVGGTKFFERKEIKDVLSYMCVVNNPSDTVRLKRIINEPKRGIGDATVKKAEDIAEGMGISLFEVLKQADSYPALSRSANSLISFTNMIEELRDFEQSNDLDDFYDELLDKTGYTNYLVAQGNEGKTRLENVEELKSNIIKYIDENDELAELSGFLEEVALYTDLDSVNNDDDYVLLMTVHSAKGLEFPYVFIVGMEETIFPGTQSMYSPEEIQEERRLAYVAITRAKEKLYITNASQRMIFGQTKRNSQSRFIAEIPQNLYELVDNTGRGESFVSTSNYSKSSFGSVNTYSATSSTPKSQKTYNSFAPKPKTQKAEITYSVGDTVSHITFGEGTVVSITPMANDYMVEINFTKVGTKKLMANFAKLKKL